MDFEVVGPVRNIEPIAAGPSLRQGRRLHRRYGRGRWRKLKGVAKIRTTAEVHWYEAHGIGRREMKVKFPLLD